MRVSKSHFWSPSNVFLRKTESVLTPAVRFRMSTGRSHKQLTTPIRGISLPPVTVPSQAQYFTRRYDSAALNNISHLVPQFIQREEEYICSEEAGTYAVSVKCNEERPQCEAAPHCCRYQTIVRYY